MRPIQGAQTMLSRQGGLDKKALTTRPRKQAQTTKPRQGDLNNRFSGRGLGSKVQTISSLNKEAKTMRPRQGGLDKEAQIRGPDKEAKKRRPR